MNDSPAVTYRADVVGSLLRPEYLKQAVQQFEAGAISVEALREAQDRAGLEAITLQEGCGLDVITDGEVRRSFWFDPLTESLSGYSRTAPTMVPFTSVHGTVTEELALPTVTAPLGLKDNLPLREFTFLQAHAQKPGKVTLPSLTYASVLWAPGGSAAVYPDRDAYLQDALRLMREIVAACVAAGAHYIQLDAPRYTHMVSEVGRATFARLQINTRTWLGEMIALDNALIAGFPGVSFGLHLCRGNNRSMWSVEGGYDAIAEQLFNDITVQRLLLEYDSPRAGSFAPLRFVPADKTAVLGLITTKEPELESPDLLKRRIEEASRYIPIERLALSPQCGFASTLPGNLVTAAVQGAKLELLANVARQVWG
ncbi:MAG: uroporphyrinogen decarboxylase/cobalamine-independent methonine synthase family protein [Dehalococcoidia bacterium]